MKIARSTLVQFRELSIHSHLGFEALEICRLEQARLDASLCAQNPLFSMNLCMQFAYLTPIIPHDMAMVPHTSFR